MIVHWKRPKPNNAVMTMVVPGRRALGEEWRKVTIRPEADGGYTTENEPAQAPPGGVPVVIPALANLSDAEINFILEGALKFQEYQSRRPRRRPVSDPEIQRMVQSMWNDYVENKLKGLKGQTTLGPGGYFQRESPGIKRWTGVKG